MKITFEGSCEEIYRILERVVSVPDRTDMKHPRRYLCYYPALDGFPCEDWLKCGFEPETCGYSKERSKPLSDENGDGGDEQHPQLTKDDIWIEKFKHALGFEKKYKRLMFTELTDGRVVLSAWSAKVYTTRERIMKIPFPIPKGYLDGLGVSSSYIYAIKYYREYLAEQEEDEKYKPMLKGAFSTRPADHDGSKLDSIDEVV